MQIELASWRACVRQAAATTGSMCRIRSRFNGACVNRGAGRGTDLARSPTRARDSHKLEEKSENPNKRLKFAQCTSACRSMTFTTVPNIPFLRELLGSGCIRQTDCNEVPFG